MLLIPLLTAAALAPHDEVPPLDPVRLESSRFTATYEGRRLHFDPAGNGEADVVGLEVLDVRRGDEVLFDPRVRPRARVEGEALRIERPGFQERYDQRHHGLEQSFVFHERLEGEGDLVVRLDVDTQLEVIYESARHVTYGHPGEGLVSVQGVVGIDANGRRQHGTMRVTDGGLDLMLPADFVDGAAYPLVLDPVIVPLAAVFGEDGSSLTDVAWEGGSDLCCLAWNEVFWEDDGDYILVTFLGTLDSTGAALGAFPVFTTSAKGPLTRPSICNVNQHGQVVIGTQEDAGWDAVVTLITVDPVNPGMTFDTKSFETPWIVSHDLGGDATLDTSIVQLVWTANGSVGGATSAYTIEMDGSGGADEKAEVELDDGSMGHGRNPRISQSGATNGVWMVVWERILHASGVTQPQVTTLHADPEYNFEGFSWATSFDGHQPSVDGDGETWIVSYRRQRSSGWYEIIGEVWTGGVGHFGPAVGYAYPLEISQNELSSPQVAVLPYDDPMSLSGSACAVSWSEELPGGATDCNYVVRETLTLAPITMSVNVTNQLWLDQRIASRWSADFTVDRPDVFAFGMKIPMGIARAYATP